MFNKLLETNCILWFIIFYSFLSYGRNTIWITEYGLWHDALVNSQNKVRPHLNAANVLVRIGLPKEAIKKYKFVQENDHQNFAAHIGLGTAYFFIKNFDGAIVEFQKAVSIRPDSSIAHANLGNVFMAKKLFDNAIAELKIAIRLWPDDYSAHQNLSVAYKQSGLLKEAEEEAKIAGILKQENNIQYTGGYGIIQR